MTMKELSKKRITKDIQLVDVRTHGEYRNHHVKGAVNIPLKKLRRQIDELGKDKETIVICQTGIRSMQACKTLKKQGFENLANVKGGMISE